MIEKYLFPKCLDTFEKIHFYGIGSNLPYDIKLSFGSTNELLVFEFFLYV